MARIEQESSFLRARLEFIWDQLQEWNTLLFILICCLNKCITCFLYLWFFHFVSLDLFVRAGLGFKTVFLKPEGEGLDAILNEGKTPNAFLDGVKGPGWGSIASHLFYLKGGYFFHSCWTKSVRKKSRHYKQQINAKSFHCQECNLQFCILILGPINQLGTTSGKRFSLEIPIVKWQHFHIIS